MLKINLPTKHGTFQMLEFNGGYALMKGDVSRKEEVLTRVHSSCFTSEVFGSLRCDCQEQLQDALMRIEQEGIGILIYLQQEGRGIGLSNKLKAYQLQEQGYDTVEANEKLGFAADLRDYTAAARLLQSLGVKSVRLLTNNPRKVKGLQEKGIKVERGSSIMDKNQHNAFYLETKKEKLGHLL